MPKRRANGEGNIRKRKDGRWEGRYTVGHDPETGKAIIKNVLGKTQAEVKEKLKKAIEENVGIDYGKAKTYTVGSWLEVWMENYAKVKLRPSTFKTSQGFLKNHIKPQIGSVPLDVARLSAIREVVPKDICIRIDANQGWTPKQAVRILNNMQDRGLDIEFVEQPVKALDFDGMKYVTERSYVPVLADESVFSPADALKIMQMGAADMVNIKLMKCAGITNALKIASAAEVYGVECMIGCMLEAKISVTAAVHLACAKSIITKIDLDGPVLCKEDPIIGGAVFNEKLISLPNEPGLGIKGIEEGKIHYID